MERQKKEGRVTESLAERDWKREKIKKKREKKEGRAKDRGAEQKWKRG